MYVIAALSRMSRERSSRMAILKVVVAYWLSVLEISVTIGKVMALVIRQFTIGLDAIGQFQKGVSDAAVRRNQEISMLTISLESIKGTLMISYTSARSAMVWSIHIWV